MSTIIYILLIVALWQIFKKAGEEKSLIKAIIPIVNVFVLFKITWGRGILFFLLFVPWVNVVVAAITCHKLSKSFGRSGLFTLGLIFLNPIFMMILGFGKAQYLKANKDFVQDDQNEKYEQKKNAVIHNGEHLIEEQNDIDPYVKKLFSYFDIDYHVNENTDIQVIEQCLQKCRRVLENDEKNKMYQLFNEGYIDYIYSGYDDDRFKKAKYNDMAISGLAFALMKKGERYNSRRYLKEALFCYKYNYEKDVAKLLEDDAISCAAILLSYIPDSKERLTVLNMIDDVYSRMIKANLYEKGEIYIHNCEILSKYYLEYADENHIGYYEKAVFYKNPTAYEKLASIYSQKNPDKALQICFESSEYSLMTNIIDKPLNDIFDDGCQSYKEKYYDSSLDAFEVLADDSSSEEVRAASHYNVGIHYLNHLVGYEERDALEEFTKAAELGLSEAQFILAVLYLKNIKREDWNDEKCFETLSSLQGVNKGILSYYLAKCYKEGIGTAVEKTKTKEYEQEYKDYYYYMYHS